MNDALTVTGLRKSYAGHEVVAGIDFSVPRGTCFGLLGPNGAGKTTTLRCCLGLTTPDAGSIHLCGTTVPEDSQRARERTGIVPQFDNLDPDFTVSENLRVYGRYFGLSHAVINDRIPALLEFAGLEGKANANIQTLSGGMKRRLTLARALINDPEVIIADEPTANLDTALSKEFMSILEGFTATGKTVLLTSHDPLVVDSTAVHRVVGMRDGRLTED